MFRCKYDKRLRNTLNAVLILDNVGQIRNSKGNPIVTEQWNTSSQYTANMFCFAQIWDMRTDAGMIGSLGGPHICGEAIDIKVRCHSQCPAGDSLVSLRAGGIYSV